MAVSNENIILNIEEMIDLSLRPQHINFNLLHTVLRIISAKLELHKTVVLIQRHSNLHLPKFHDNLIIPDEPEIYKIESGAETKPFDLDKLELLKIERTDVPIDTLVKLSNKTLEQHKERISSGGGEYHLKTSEKQSVAIESKDIYEEVKRLKEDVEFLKQDHKKVHDVCEKLNDKHSKVIHKTLENENLKKDRDDLNTMEDPIDVSLNRNDFHKEESVVSAVTNRTEHSESQLNEDIASMNTDEKLSPIIKVEIKRRDKLRKPSDTSDTTAYPKIPNVQETEKDPNLDSHSDVTAQTSPTPQPVEDDQGVHEENKRKDKQRNKEKDKFVITNEHWFVISKQVSEIAMKCDEYFAKNEKRLENFEEFIRREKEMKHYWRCIKDNVALLSQIKPLEKQQKVNMKDLCNVQETVGFLSSRVEHLVNCVPAIQENVQQLNEKQYTNLKAIKGIHNRLREVIDWKTSIIQDLETFVRRYEFLKTTKADCAEIDFIMRTKSDQKELQKYVPIDYFRSVEDDFRKGYTQCMENILKNEEIIQNVREEIKCMIDGKYDKSQATNFKRYIDCKFDIIEKLLNHDDTTTNQNRNILLNAAAIRNPIIKEGYCISCSTQAELNPFVSPLPKFEKFKEPTTLLTVNRYCGGGHTVLEDNDKKSLRKKSNISKYCTNHMNCEYIEPEILPTGMNIDENHVEDKYQCDKTKYR